MTEPKPKPTGTGVKCRRCEKELEKFELPQPGLPPFCTICLRAELTS